jgi:acyl carrier protein
MENAMSQFLERVAGVLEMPSVMPDFALRSTPGWGSLMGFALIIMLEQEYHVKLTVEEFLKLETVADLANAAGVNA